MATWWGKLGKAASYSYGKTSTKWKIAGTALVGGGASLVWYSMNNSQSGLHAKAKDTSEVPGDVKTYKTAALSVGSDLLQSRTPLNEIHSHLCGVHFYNGEPSRQVVAHHYCSKLNEDFHQCVLFDSDQSTARLIGVEYIVSEKMFRSFPEDEKKYWHSHLYEVTSGELVAPGIPDTVENTLMRDLIPTYGKTVHTWEVDNPMHPFPYGAPKLMMALTDEGQVNEKLLKERDKYLGVSTAEKKESRKDLPRIIPEKGSDSWKTGKIVQFTTQESLRSERAQSKIMTLPTQSDIVAHSVPPRERLVQ